MRPPIDQWHAARQRRAHGYALLERQPDRRPCDAPPRRSPPTPCSPFRTAKKPKAPPPPPGEEARGRELVARARSTTPRPPLEYARRLASSAKRFSQRWSRDARLLREAAHHGRLEGPDQRSHLDGSFRINEGLRLARQLLLDVNELGLPAGCEFLD